MRFGWFSSGRDRAARDLLEAAMGAINASRISATIEFVFCNRERGESEEADEFLNTVGQMGIPCVSLSSRRFEPELQARDRAAWRQRFDRRVTELTKVWQSDVGVLAGYMLIMSGALFDAMPMINLHPAKPGGPAGAWEDVIWQVIQNQDDAYGAMVHLVTEELDAGPCLTYCTFRLDTEEFAPQWKVLDRKLERESLASVREREPYSEPLFSAIRRAEASRELPLLLETMRLLADGSLKIEGHAIHYQGAQVHGGICLNEAVEQGLQA